MEWTVSQNCDIRIRFKDIEKKPIFFAIFITLYYFK